MRLRWPVATTVLALLLTACAPRSSGMMGPGMNMDAGMMQRHMATIPDEYADLTNPIPADAESLVRGRMIYDTNCAACHGDSGWGDGPAAANFDPPPASLTHTAPMLSEAYLFYRISEGGNFAPFNSAMPAWKDKLNETERWKVINYIRSLGGNAMMGDGMTGMMGWMMAPWWFLGWALVIGVVVAVVLAITWTVRRSRGSAQPLETPLETLKRRYVQGELSSEQFEMRKRQLSGE